MVEVAPPATGIAVDFGVDGDTLGVWGKTTVNYRLHLGGKRFAYTDVFLDGEPLLSTQSLSSFEIDSRTLRDGPHELRLEAYAHSGTGSLADRLGAEFVLDRQTGVLVVDNAAPKPVDVKTVEVKEGRPVVTWERYPRANFQSYRLYRGLWDGSHVPHGCYSEGYSSSDTYLVATIDDPAQTSWSDPRFVGGNVCYRVEVEAADQRAKGRPVVYEAPIPSLTGFTPLGERRIRLTWSATKFPANFARYILTRYEDRHFKAIATLNGTEDTTFVDTISRFGEIALYNVTTESSAGDIRRTDEELRAWVDPQVEGIGMPQRLGDHYVARADSHLAVYSARYPDLVLIDGSSKEILARYGPNFGPFAATPDGTRLFSVKDRYVIEHDVQTLAPIREIDLRDLFGYEVRVGHLRAVDGGRLLFQVAEFRDGTRYVRGNAIIDIEPLRLIDQQYVKAMSADGRYYIAASSLTDGNALYEITDGRPEAVSDLPETCPGRRALAFFFFLEHGDAFAERCGSEITIRRTSDLAEERTFSITPDLEELGYDAESGYVFGVGEGRFQMYDLRSGAEVASIDVAPIGTFWGGSYALINGTLWSGHGFYRALDLD